MRQNIFMPMLLRNSPEIFCLTLNIVADNNMIAASFADHGIWLYAGGDWTNLTPEPARALALDSGMLVVSIDGSGTWLNDGEWSNILAVTADLLALDGGKVVASFEGQGIWLYE